MLHTANLLGGTGLSHSSVTRMGELEIFFDQVHDILIF